MSKDKPAPTAMAPAIRHGTCTGQYGSRPSRCVRCVAVCYCAAAVTTPDTFHQTRPHISTALRHAHKDVLCSQLKRSGRGGVAALMHAIPLGICRGVAPRSEPAHRSKVDVAVLAQA